MSVLNKIILLEDEDPIRRGVRLNLEAEGYSVAEYRSAEEALADLGRMGDFSLGIFDIMLPGENGLDFCKRLRSSGFRFPVIFLSARSRLEDKLAGFESGGDDYLTKPFELEELLARVRARLRSGGEEKASDTARIGEFLVDLQAGSARSINNSETHRFNERETAILRLLIENRGKAVSRSEILDQVWGTAEFPSNRTIDNYIVKFRGIFEPEKQKPRYIITRHGTGYELALEE